MISNIDSNYYAICKLFDFKKKNSADINKKILLGMAKNGQERPRWNTKIGRALIMYTCKFSSGYDGAFTRQIKILSPSWLLGRSEKNKTTLLNMAKNGEPKPKSTTKIGKAFISYTCKSSRIRDFNFIKQITEHSPNWLASKSERLNNTKQILIKMAKNGEEKPHWKTKLSKSLTSYISKKSKTYDPVFTKQIKKLRPDWFKK